MGQVKDWGFDILENLTGLVKAGNSVPQAVDKLVDTMMASGDFKDRNWLRGQVSSVADHPETFGQTTNYWQKIRHIGAQARRRPGLRRKGRGIIDEDR